MRCYPKKPEACHRARGRPGYSASAPAPRPPWTGIARDGRHRLGQDGGMVLPSIEQRNGSFFDKGNHGHSSLVHTGSALPMTDEAGTSPK